MTFPSILSLPLALLAAAPASTATTGTPAASQRLDGIAAVVNDEVVLQSDVEEQLYLFLLRAQTQPDSSQLDTLRHEILDQLIDEKVIVAEAKRQGITVTDDEVEKQVEQAIADAKTRLGSEAAFHEQLARENLTEEKLRDKYRTEVRRQLLAQRLVQKQIPVKTVSPSEAEAYFRAHPDKFPKVPAEVRLSVIQIPVMADSGADARGHAAALAARRRVAGGEKFAKVAQEVSDDDRTSHAGGDLGFFGPGALDPALEQAALHLKVGQLSQPIRSSFGWHVLQVLDRDTLKTVSGQDSLTADGEPFVEVHARHIAIQVPVSDADVHRAQQLADHVRDLAVRGTAFGVLVQRYSKFQGNADPNGDIGFISLATLQPNIRAGLDSLKTGEISGVLQNSVGFNIFKVTDRHPERQYRLDEIRDQLPEAVANVMHREAYDAWVKNLRAKAHIEIRDS